MKTMAEIVAEEARRQGFPADIAVKVLGAERSGADAVSPKGAKGHMQTMDPTQQGLEKLGYIPAGLDPFKPEDSAKIGVSTLVESFKRTNSIPATIAEYNGGTVARKAVEAGQQPPAEETRKYMNNVLGPQAIEQQAGNPASSGSGSKSDTTRVINVADGVRNSTSTTTVSRPGFAADVANIMNFYAPKFEATRESLITNTAGAQAQQKIIGEQSVKQGQAAGTIAEATAEVNAMRNQQSIDVLNKMSGSLNDPTSAISQGEIMMATLRNKQNALRPAIENNMAINPVDDLLGWVGAQIELVGQKREYNAIRRQEIAYLQQREAIQTGAAKQQALDLPHTVDQFRQIGAAGKAQAAAEGALKAAEAASGAYKMAVVLNQELAGMDTQDRQLKIQNAWKLADTETVRSAQTEEDKKMMPDLNLLNKKRESINLRPFELSNWKDMGAKARTEYMEWAYLPGMGTDFGNTMENMHKMDGFDGFAENFPEASKQMYALSKSRDVEELVKLGKKDNPKADEFKLRADAMSKISMSWVASAEPDQKGKVASNKLDPKNPLRMSTLTLANIPELQNNMFTRMVKDQNTINIHKPLTDEDLLSNAVNLVVADPTQLDRVANEGSDYFRIGMNKQYERYQLGQFGVKRPQLYYMGEIEGTLERGEQLNTFDRAQFKRYLLGEATRLRSQMAMQQYGQAAASMLPTNLIGQQQDLRAGSRAAQMQMQNPEIK